MARRSESVGPGMIGELIAQRYELRELCGTGGMSTVFRAHDRQLERTVALKFLHERHLGDEESVERFRREARSAAPLSHPHIVTVIDRGEHDGRPFIVFEYVVGENLKQRIREQGALPIPEALRLALEVGSALAFAHQHGLVHRDVKPQNVLLTDEGRAKMTDFGIARSLDVQRGLTQTGTVLGTSEYIAPEQAQGASVDERTDVYSLGVVLYELLTGEVPFHGDSFVEVALRHVNEPPPSVRDRRPDVPPRLAQAVERALAKRPRDRFASMNELCAELEACLRDRPVPVEDETIVVRPAPRRRRIWPVVAFAGGLAALVGIAVGVYALRDEGEQGGASAQAAPVSLEAVGAYDPPPGDGEEHDADAGLATDGDLDTSWRTEGYRSTLADLGKSGIGLVLDAGRPTRVTRLTIITATPGFTAYIRAGASVERSSRVSPSKSVGGTTTFQLTGGEQRYYVVWITELPNELRARVNEVQAA
jgi:hypothetical protein